MKTFNRASLPKEIRYNNKTYVHGEKSEKSIRVLVLSGKLKGKTNIHNKPYKPSEWYYNPI